jgi:GNAT superfamily N-acetyltransferase
VAALQAGRLAGFLLSQTRADTQRDRHVWVHLAGHALDPAADAELYHDLYATAGQGWLEQGYFDHYVMVPAAWREEVQPWLQLSFAHEQVHALLSLAEDQPDPAAELTPSARQIEIRLASPEDRATLADMSPLIRRHLAGPPIWGAALPEDEEEIRQGYADLAGDPAVAVWLAFLDGQPVGMQAFFPPETGEDDLFAPESCIQLAVAATVPAARGTGIAQSLSRHCLREARAAGYAWCSADWRIANRAASHLLTGLGFRPVAYRLVRKVDRRALWAR